MRLFIVVPLACSERTTCLISRRRLPSTLVPAAQTLVFVRRPSLPQRLFSLLSHIHHTRLQATFTSPLRSSLFPTYTGYHKDREHLCSTRNEEIANLQSMKAMRRSTDNNSRLMLFRYTRGPRRTALQNRTF